MPATACHRFCQFVTLLLTASLALAAAAQERPALTEHLTPEQAARYEVFDDFTIRGICGTSHLDLARKFGVNTIRGYTLSTKPDGTQAILDAAHQRGMKMIVSEWMPHQGENKGNNGGTWNNDYRKSPEKRLANFMKKVEALGDHPAILMWGLGNEVHLDPEYLEFVNIMSEAIHEKYPLALTSLTMVNAKPEHIERIKKHAPDLDVLGVQSYSLGAIRGGIKNMEQLWKKPYYYSEFNGKGPWNFRKTPWGTAYDDLPADRAAEFAEALKAIEEAPRSLGSTAFVWSHFGVQRPNYFSMLLSEHPAGFDAAEREGMSTAPLITPVAQAMGERFTGTKPTANTPPVVTLLTGRNDETELIAKAGKRFRVRVTSEDADGDPITHRAWIIAKKGRKHTALTDPVEKQGDGYITLVAPDKPRSDCLVMVYALDGKGGGSATTIPLNVTQ